MAETKPVTIERHHINGHFDAHIVKKGIAGLNDGITQINVVAVPPLLPVPVLPLIIFQLVKTRIIDAVGGCNCATFQCRKTVDWLDNGSRGVLPLKNPIKQRPINGAEQCIVIFKADPGHKFIGIKPGSTGHGKHTSRGHINSHHSTSLISHALVGDPLQTTVQMQVQILTRLGLDSLQLAHHPSPGIGFNRLVAYLTKQFIFVEIFQSGFTHHQGATITNRIELLYFAVIDTPHITQHMRKLGTKRIMAQQLDSDFNALQPVFIDSEDSLLPLTQVQSQRNRLIGSLATLEQFVKALSVSTGNSHQFFQLIKQDGKVFNAFHNYGEIKAGAVISEQHPIAVENKPTGRRHRFNQYPVAVRKRYECVMSLDLEMVIAPEQPTRQQ